MTDGSAAKLADYTYEAYGKASADAASTNAFQFTGRENDGTGLYYFRARYQHPALGRFISEDPIGLAGGANTYAYVNNNPVRYRDPLGLEPGTSSQRGYPEPQPPAMCTPEPSEPDVEPGLEGVHPECSLAPFRALCTVLGYGGSVSSSKARNGKQRGGTPKNNQAQNKQARDAANEAGLNKDQRRQLHDAISGQDLGYQEIVDIAKDIKSGKY